MDEIWANRLCGGTKTWAEMPSSRRANVKAILNERVRNGALTAEEYQKITGEVCEQDNTGEDTGEYTGVNEE